MSETRYYLTRTARQPVCDIFFEEVGFHAGSHWGILVCQDATLNARLEQALAKPRPGFERISEADYQHYRHWQAPRVSDGPSRESHPPASVPESEAGELEDLDELCQSAEPVEVATVYVATLDELAKALGLGRHSKDFADLRQQADEKGVGRTDDGYPVAAFRELAETPGES